MMLMHIMMQYEEAMLSSSETKKDIDKTKHRFSRNVCVKV